MDTLDILFIAYIVCIAAVAIVMTVIIGKAEADWRRQRLITLYEMIRLEKELYDESIRQLEEMKRRNMKAAEEAGKAMREGEE